MELNGCIFLFEDDELSVQVIKEKLISSPSTIKKF